MLIDHAGQVIEAKDPNAQGLRSLLSIPLEKIVSTIAEEHSAKAIQQTYEEVSELKRDGLGFSNTLASTLPCDADGMPESLKTMIEAEYDETMVKQLADKRQSIKAKIIRKKMIDESPYLA